MQKTIILLYLSLFFLSCEEYDFKTVTHPPSNPSPANGAGGISTSSTLSWTNPDGDTKTYDVYFDTSSNPTTAIATGQTTTNIGRSGLSYNTTYYWKIVANDNKGAIISGPVWNFTVSLAIGHSYQGGIIAYILQPGDPGYVAGQTHGLIAAPSDQSTGIQWYNGSYITTGATGKALGTGNANTTDIVNAQGAGSYAAKLCYDLVLGGYSEWYLPSKDELNKLYLNKEAIGGFAGNYYWSSSESSKDYAWTQAFYDGIQSYGSKGVTLRVRAVRAF